MECPARHRNAQEQEPQILIDLELMEYIRNEKKKAPEFFPQTNGLVIHEQITCSARATTKYNTFKDTGHFLSENPEVQLKL